MIFVLLASKQCAVTAVTIFHSHHVELENKKDEEINVNCPQAKEEAGSAAQGKIVDLIPCSLTPCECANPALILYGCN